MTPRTAPQPSDAVVGVLHQQHRPLECVTTLLLLSPDAVVGVFTNKINHQSACLMFYLPQKKEIFYFFNLK
jgi:hypothetical protein